LADHFPEVTGIDVAPSMIELARTYAAAAGSACTFVLNERRDLSAFPDRTFDLVFNTLVLQHIPPEPTRPCLSELVRVLKPGGVVVYQLPSGSARTLKGPVLEAAPLRPVRLVSKADLYAIPVVEVTAILGAAGAEVIGVVDDSWAGPNWVSHTPRSAQRWLRRGRRRLSGHSMAAVRDRRDTE
jgi:SAM-dependent methyltransferase